MKWSTSIPALALAALVPAASPLWADGMSQLIAAAGLTEAEAASLSLSEIYAYKINGESGRDNKVTVSSREYPVFDAKANHQLVTSAGLRASETRGMSLEDVAVHKANRNASNDNRIAIAPAHQRGFDPAAHPQLVASAGLSIDEASGMSRTELYRLKNNREADRDNVQAAAR